MINLIPQEEKKKMTKSFYYKLLVLFLVVGGVSFLVAFVAILPSYFLSTVKYNISKDKLEKQKSEPVPLPDQQTLSVIKDLNTKLDLIEQAEKNQFLISNKVINAVILTKLPEIKITDISYETDPIKGKKINIQGIALSRPVLQSFLLALQNNILFRSVDLPISNFVKGSNIQFFLSLVPA